MLSEQTQPVSHHLHPHHISCPRCGKHSVVVRGENYFTCLNCGWRRDITSDWGPIPFLLLIALVVCLLIVAGG